MWPSHPSSIAYHEAVPLANANPHVVAGIGTNSTAFHDAIDVAGTSAHGIADVDARGGS